jgi:hypothetical protein
LGIVNNSRLSDNDLKKLEDRGALAQTLKLVAGSSSNYIKFALTFLDRRSVSRLISGDGVKQTVSDLITLKHYIQDNNGQIDKEQFNEIAENYFPDVDTLSVKDIEIVLQNFYESIPGYEYYHNLLNDMELSESDWVVYKSGSKEANKDVGYYDGNNWVLYPSEFANNTIREQVVTENLKVEGVDGTQKLQLIGYEQYEEAHTYFNSKSTSIGEIKDAHAKMLAKRVNLGFQQVKNMILTERGEAQWKFLIDSFKDNIRAAGGDPLLEEFTEMNGIRPMYNTNYSYIESRFQSAFLNFVSKEVLKHKSAQVKFTIITDKGINVARSISFNDDNIDQN